MAMEMIPSKPVEKHNRSIAKSISYRVLSVSVDSAVAFFITKDVLVSLSIVALLNTYSIILYYLHERVWAHIQWGRRTL